MGCGGVLLRNAAAQYARNDISIHAFLLVTNSYVRCCGAECCAVGRFGAGEWMRERWEMTSRTWN